jgi:5-methylcytosine-specific restriction protein A
MTTELTKEQFIEILLDKNITKEENIFDLQSLYSFDNHQAPANLFNINRRPAFLTNKEKGPQPAGPINARVGWLGKRVAKKYSLSKRENGKLRYWDLFFNGWADGHQFIWQLKPNLVKALEETGLTGNIQSAEEISTEDFSKYPEGAKRTITVNAYERNPQARKKCVEHYGTICSVCSFDFQKKYGKLGEGFIHVHHEVPISEIGVNYEIDPIKDLKPVCPNCHSMLHRGEQTLTINELKLIIQSCKLVDKTSE